MQARVVARSVVSYARGRAGGRPAPSWCRRGQGAHRGWLGAVAFLLLAAFPGVVHAQDGGTVELIFELPPGFAPDNLPGIVDDSQQEEIVLGTDSLATTSSSLGLGEEISFTEPVAEMPAEPPPETTAESSEESPAEQPSEESAAVEPAVQAAAKPASVTTFGVDATFASDVQIITLPATYRPTGATKLGIDVPFVRRTGDRGSVFELGDVSFSAGYRWGDPLHVLGITTFFVKAPTGDPAARDEGEFLPTGSGSWDFALYQTFIHRFGLWRGELTAGYRLNTEADFDAAGADITLENGNVANLILGADHELAFVPGLMGSLALDARHIQEADLTIDGVDQETPGALLVVDLLPRVKYFLAAGTAIRAGLRIPLNHWHDRDLVIDLGVVQRF